MKNSSKNIFSNGGRNISEELLERELNEKLRNCSLLDYESYDPKRDGKTEKNEDNLNLNQKTTEVDEDLKQAPPPQGYKGNNKSNCSLNCNSPQSENIPIESEIKETLSGKIKHSGKKYLSFQHPISYYQKKLKKKWGYKFYILKDFGNHRDAIIKKAYKKLKILWIAQKKFIFKKNIYFYLFSRNNRIKEISLTNYINNEEENLIDYQNPINEQNFIYHQNLTDNQNLSDYRNFLGEENLFPTVNEDEEILNMDIISNISSNNPRIHISDLYNVQFNTLAQLSTDFPE